MSQYISNNLLTLLIKTTSMIQMTSRLLSFHSQTKCSSFCYEPFILNYTMWNIMLWSAGVSGFFFLSKSAGPLVWQSCDFSEIVVIIIRLLELTPNGYLVYSNYLTNSVTLCFQYIRTEQLYFPFGRRWKSIFLHYFLGYTGRACLNKKKLIG